jgi:hypothetical protein
MIQGFACVCVCFHTTSLTLSQKIFGLVFGVRKMRVNEGWAMDFVSDWVVGPNEQAVRIINIMDECSRKALWTQAHSSISALQIRGSVQPRRNKSIVPLALVRTQRMISGR